jgi:hypothetical protein
VPVGTLSLSTPFGPGQPIDLGTLALTADGRMLSSSIPVDGIVITDRASGDQPYSVTALATALSNGKADPNSTINAENVGLTGISTTSSPGFAGVVTSFSNPAAAGVAPSDPGAAGLGGSTPHEILSVTQADGTVTIDSTFTVNAPTTTEPGLFVGTVELTVG